MEIKGVSVTAAPNFVQLMHESRYGDWLESLPPTSRKIVENTLLSNWYPVDESVIVPTKKVCDLFFNGSEQGAWAVGRTSADLALKGVYRFFVKLGSPEFILTRASSIFSNMFRPGEIKVTAASQGSALLEMTVPESFRLLELRMAGWMEQALIISGCSQSKVVISASITKGSSVTEFSATW
jgi:hypothetical protein